MPDTNSNELADYNVAVWLFGAGLTTIPRDNNASFPLGMVDRFADHRLTLQVN